MLRTRPFATAINGHSSRHGRLPNPAHYDKSQSTLQPRTRKLPLTLNVFKFSNLSALASPQYRWTELGNATYNATSLSYVFNTTSVFLNASVTKGDKLGIQISGSDFAPYCHLEYDVPASSDLILLQQGAGQNSWRGLDGKKTAIYQRVGKAVKFFAVVT